LIIAGRGVDGIVQECGNRFIRVSAVIAPPPASARFIEPMLLLRTDSLPSGEQWLYEPRLDGYRAIGFRRNGDVSLRSRNNNDFNARYPAVVKVLGKLPDSRPYSASVLTCMTSASRISQQSLWRGAVRKGFNQLLCRPGRCRVLGKIDVNALPALMHQHDEDEQDSPRRVGTVKKSIETSVAT